MPGALAALSARAYVAINPAGPALISRGTAKQLGLLGTKVGWQLNRMLQPLPACSCRAGLCRYHSWHQACVGC